nr:MAG TPA: hypothetical protein [Caudoviricetes sp.]
MSSVKLLLDVVGDMRSLADSIQAVCDAMESESLSDNGGEQETVKEKREETKEEVKKEENESPNLTLEKVRAVLAEKSRAGGTSEVRAIIQKFGAKRLSEIDPKDYAAILKEAEVL